MSTTNIQVVNSQKALRMEVLIYAPLFCGGFDDEPMECTVFGKDESTTVLELKDDLDEAVITTLTNSNYGSNDYLVEFRLEKDGEYVDHEEPCQCKYDAENQTIEWRDE